MKTSTLLALGGLGFAAWYLSRQRGGAAPGVGVSTDDATIAGDSFVDRPDFWLDIGRRGDHCDLPTGSAASTERDEAWNQEQLACAARWHYDRAQLFYDQVYLPASRVSISSLTAEDYKLAMAILTGKVDRSGVPLTYGQSQRINDMYDSVGWAADIIGPLGSIASLFGAKVDTQSAADSINALLDEYAASVTTLAAHCEGNETDLVLDPGPVEPAQNYLSAQLFTAPTRKDVLSPFINGYGPSMDFGYPPILFPWGALWFRGGLLAPDPYGTGTWKHGFVCRETGYADGDVTDKRARPDRIAKIAKAWRALDVIGTALRPYRQTVLVKGNYDLNAEAINVSDLNIQYRVPGGLYAYAIGAIELWGCTLPAHPDDNARDLAGELGRTLAGSNYVGNIDEQPEQTGDINQEGAALAEEAYVPPDLTISPYVTSGAAVYVPPSSDAGATTTFSKTTRTGR